MAWSSVVSRPCPLPATGALTVKPWWDATRRAAASVVGSAATSASLIRASVSRMTDSKPRAARAMVDLSRARRALERLALGEPSALHPAVDHIQEPGRVGHPAAPQLPVGQQLLHGARAQPGGAVGDEPVAFGDADVGAGADLARHPLHHLDVALLDEDPAHPVDRPDRLAVGGLGGGAGRQRYELTWRQHPAQRLGEGHDALLDAAYELLDGGPELGLGQRLPGRSRQRLDVRERQVGQARAEYRAAHDAVVGAIGRADQDGAALDPVQIGPAPPWHAVTHLDREQIDRARLHHDHPADVVEAQEAVGRQLDGGGPLGEERHELGAGRRRGDGHAASLGRRTKDAGLMRRPSCGGSTR